MSSSPAGARFPTHGGDLAFATETYGIPADGWLDLSTGINPVSYPFTVIPPVRLARLPDRQSFEQLLAHARRVYGVPDGVGIAAVPGSEIALRALPYLAPPGPVAVVGPTYGSHAEAWRSAGRDVAEVPSLDRIPQSATVTIVGNPNNPDGRIFPPATLTELAKRLASRSGLLIVDEAFADVAPEASLVPHLAATPALVLRSFGKFFGLAGLRLGFATGALSESIAALLGDWPVSGAAITIGTAALANDAWQAGARERLKRDAARLTALLAGHRLTVAGGTDLFALVEDRAARALHVALAGHGIWTRAFASEPHWLRFGLPGSEADFARLDAALRAFR